MVTVKVVGFTGHRWNKIEVFRAKNIALHLTYDRFEVALCRKPVRRRLIIITWWIVSSYVSGRFKTQKVVHIQFLRFMLAFYPRAHPNGAFPSFRTFAGFGLTPLKAHMVTFWRVWMETQWTLPSHWILPAPIPWQSSFTWITRYVER